MRQVHHRRRKLSSVWVDDAQVRRILGKGNRIHDVQPDLTPQLDMDLSLDLDEPLLETSLS